MTVHLNKLMRKPFSFMNVSAKDDKTKSIENEMLDQILNKIHRYEANLNVKSNLNVNTSYHGSDTYCSIGETAVLDPPTYEGKRDNQC